jgi:hypothetical protein
MPRLLWAVKSGVDAKLDYVRFAPTADLIFHGTFGSGPKPDVGVPSAWELSRLEGPVGSMVYVDVNDLHLTT